MGDSDIQNVLATRKGRVPVLPPAPAGGYDANSMPSDTTVYTLNNREKTENIQHTAEELAKILEDRRAKEAARNQTGGADTDAEERRGAGVGVQLIENVSRLHDLYKKDPTLLIPSTAEEYAAQHGAAIAPGATPQERELNARTYYLNHYEKDRAEGRLQAYTSTKAALEAAAHTAGARYSPEENALNTNIYGIGPFDTPREAGLKLANWASLIERDRAQAGAGNLMLGGDKLTPEALAFLDKIKAFPDYLHNQKFLPNGGLDQEAHQLSTTEQSVPLPTGMQQEHANYLAQIPRGKLTPEMYADLRNALNQKYMNGKAEPFDPSNPEIQAYVKGFNDPSVHITNTIPSQVKYLDPDEQRRAALDSSAPAVAVQHFASGLTAGVPDMLAGDKGREATKIAAEAHPLAAGGGDFAGQVAATLLGERAVGAGLDAATGTGHALLPQLLADEAKRKVVADVAANAGYGAANAGTHGDNIAAGAVLGAGGSLGGRAITRGAKGFMGTQALDDLNQLRGVDLTVPQAIGAGKLEEMLRDVPIIRGARERAEGSYNLNNNERTLALANQGLPEPQLDPAMPFGTKPGTNANAVMHDRIGAGYDEVLPNISGQRTNAFGLNMVGKEADIAQMGKKPFSFYAQNVRPIQDILFDKDGNFTGSSYKDARGRLSTVEDQLRELQNPSVNFQGDPMTPSQATEMLGHIGDMKQHLEDMMVELILFTEK